MKSSGCEYQYGSKQKIKRAAVSGRRLRTAVPIALLIILALMSAAMLIFSLFTRAELTAVSDENLELSHKLDSLLEENRRLRIEYEFAQNLDELEKDAKERLGMQSSLQRREQTIDTEPEDKAVVIDNG